MSIFNYIRKKLRLDVDKKNRKKTLLLQFFYFQLDFQIVIYIFASILLTMFLDLLFFEQKEKSKPLKSVSNELWKLFAASRLLITNVDDERYVEIEPDEPFDLTQSVRKIQTTPLGFADDLETFIERKGNAQVMGPMRKVIIRIERMQLQHLKLTTMALCQNRTSTPDPDPERLDPNSGRPSKKPNPKNVTKRKARINCIA